jgi:hypothetical protein
MSAIYSRWNERTGRRVNPGMEREHTPCPECGRPAEVLYRTTLASTDGPVEHLKTRCAEGHWFFMAAPAPTPKQLSPADLAARFALSAR